ALRSAFSIDLRSLALFRVMTAMAVIAINLTLWPDVQTWLTDYGLNSRSDAIARLSPNHLSLYYLSGSAWYSIFLLLAALIAALAMLFGWHTTPATIATWVLTASLANRIPILT